MRPFYKLLAAGWSIIAALLSVIMIFTSVGLAVSIPKFKSQPTITPVPSAEYLCIIGDVPYVLIPVRTRIALTASPTFVGSTPTRIPSSTPTATPTPLSECTMSGVVTATTLNVRSGPGAEFAIVGSLSLDDAVRIAETKEVIRPDGTKAIWLRLCAGGWASASYVRVK